MTDRADVQRARRYIVQHRLTRSEFISLFPAKFVRNQLNELYPQGGPRVMIGQQVIPNPRELEAYRTVTARRVLILVRSGVPGDRQITDRHLYVVDRKGRPLKFSRATHRFVRFNKVEKRGLQRRL